MKKTPVETRELITFIKAMNGEEGLICELKSGQHCRIVEMQLTPGSSLAQLVCVKAIIKTEDDALTAYQPEQLRLYRREFEDGDYVHQQCGDIVICAGVQRNKYLFHAALDDIGELEYPDSEFYLYGSVLQADRLCTDEEIKRMDAALQKVGKRFDPVKHKLVDCAVTTERGLFGKFMEACDNWKRVGNTVPQFKGCILGGPIISQRGKLTSRDEIQECITTYESRILELTTMCNEIYKELDDLKKKKK